MVAISILPQVQFGPNDHREGAPHFSTHLSDRKYDLDIELAKTESRLVLKENGINELNRTIIQLMVANNQMIGIKFSSCPICFNHVSISCI